MLAAHVMEVPADIQTVRPGTPPILAECVLRCLAKNRADRWQSAEELISQLEAIPNAGSGGGMTPAQTAPHKATAARRRNNRGVMIGAAIAVVAIGAAAGAYVMSRSTVNGNARIEKMGVMPIEDISGKDSVFVAAMHDALTSALTRANVTGVASRSAMMR